MKILMSSSVKHPFNARLKLVELNTNKTESTTSPVWEIIKEIIKEKTEKPIWRNWLNIYSSKRIPNITI